MEFLAGRFGVDVPGYSILSDFELLDWTGWQTRKDKYGVIPTELFPILQRPGGSSDTWVDTLKNFDRWFRRAAG